MALKLYDKLTPSGEFALMDAADVEMPGGLRLDKVLSDAEQVLSQTEKGLSELEEKVDNISVSYPLQSEGVDLQPEQYYTFGEVDSLWVNLVEVEDGKVHEHCFEFIPTEDFTGLTVTPEPKWANEPQYPAGKTCQVSILRGIGVMVSA